ncbi:hypothetical protein LY76DRAFT_230588 [Colletotrichum caudatum]|nr:hypothetical protein LY76DRAFT_230588 [Colletotrichum caudatum]
MGNQNPLRGGRNIMIKKGGGAAEHAKTAAVCREWTVGSVTHQSETKRCNWRLARFSEAKGSGGVRSHFDVNGQGTDRESQSCPWRVWRHRRRSATGCPDRG